MPASTICAQHQLSYTPSFILFVLCNFLNFVNNYLIIFYLVDCGPIRSFAQKPGIAKNLVSLYLVRIASFLATGSGALCRHYRRSQGDSVKYTPKGSNLRMSGNLVSLRGGGSLTKAVGEITGSPPPKQSPRSQHHRDCFGGTYSYYTKTSQLFPPLAMTFCTVSKNAVSDRWEYSYPKGKP